MCDACIDDLVTTHDLVNAGLGASKQGISQPLQSMSAGGGMGVIDMHQADKKRWAGDAYAVASR